MPRYATSGDYLSARSDRIADSKARESEWRRELHIWIQPLTDTLVTLCAVHPDDERAPFPPGWTWLASPDLRRWVRVVSVCESIQAQADLRQALAEGKSK